MLRLRTQAEVQEYRAELESKNATLAFVPTMGFLHQGHISLAKLSRRHAQHTMASIFVNPTQFNDKSDYEKYPTDIEHDCQMLEQVGVEAVFIPKDPQEIYAPGFSSSVCVEGLSSLWEGASRPGHFKGVTTVVSILFQSVRPHVAIFGEKDFQQLRILEQMVNDLRVPVKIVRGPLVREPDGLAMSSRNVRLSATGRQSALALSRGLRIAHDAFRGGQRDAAFLKGLVQEALSNQKGVKPDYVAVVSENTLQELSGRVESGRILVAAIVENVRLIDNLALGAVTA